MVKHKKHMIQWVDCTWIIWNCIQIYNYHEMHSYSLDAIGEYELGERKTEYPRDTGSNFTTMTLKHL